MVYLGPDDGPPFMVQKRPYREPDAWYWVIVDRRNGMTTMRRYNTEAGAQDMADRLNGKKEDA